MLATLVALILAASFFVYRDAADDALALQSEDSLGAASKTPRERKICERYWPKLWFG